MQAKVSFCIVRAVKLSRLLVVFLACNSHRMLGARGICVGYQGLAAPCLVLATDPCSDIGMRSGESA